MTAETLQLGRLDSPQIDRFAPLIPALIRATGPVSYDYQFGREGLLDRLVAVSWRTPGTLFSADCVTAATDGDNLLGIELGFAGPDFYNYKNGLAALAPDLIERGVTTRDELAGLMKRAGQASYLNAHVPEGVYYLHALSAPPEHRGRGVGRALLGAAMDRARHAGFRELQLDVLADNPAVGFYQAMGLSILAEVRSPELSRDHGFPAEFRMAVVL